MTDDEMDALLKEVTIKHGIGLSRDDPILIMQTLNKHLMKSNMVHPEIAYIGAVAD